MTLLNLNLGKDLDYRKTEYRNLENFLSLAKESAEESEFLLCWEYDAIIQNGDDGPRIREDIPAARAFEKAGQERQDASLKSGLWLFCQGRAENLKEMMEIVEWFAREAWWVQASIFGPLYVRMVKEDKKLAVQVLMQQEG